MFTFLGESVYRTGSPTNSYFLKNISLTFPYSCAIIFLNVKVSLNTPLKLCIYIYTMVSLITVYTGMLIRHTRYKISFGTYHRLVTPFYFNFRRQQDNHFYNKLTIDTQTKTMRYFVNIHPIYSGLGQVILVLEY